MTLGVFIATFLRTSNSTVEVWTSNPLTLLFHGRVLGGLGELTLGKLKMAEEMDSLAENIQVKVTDDS